MEREFIFGRWVIKYGWLLLILLTAVFLRTYQLSTIPPGLTHDEADHGITAISILEGTREIYFTIGHGREPLFDYATAVLMSVLGTNHVVGRITAVLFSLIMIAGMFAWVQVAFDRNTALLTAAGLAVGFWPVMAARQSLRSITLPAIFVLVVWLFWLGVRGWGLGTREREIPAPSPQSPIPNFIVAGIFLGLTFYTYIPARVLWIVFPLVLGYLWLLRRDLLGRSWRGALLMLLIAALTGLPLFLYLQNNPSAEIRLRELSGPLTAVSHGDFSQLGQNIIGGLKIISFVGDEAWRYNIAGRPLLQPAMSILFWMGFVIAIWYVVKPAIRREADDKLRGTASFLALSWLGIGLAPVLVTGPSLSTTQAMGMQPVLYLFPALAIARLASYGSEIEDWKLGRWFWGLVVLLFVGTAVFTWRDYFVHWANEPEVRVQYESAMATAMRYLNENGVMDTAVSTITPGQYHTPALAALMLDETITPRWFDGRGSLVIPAAETSTLIFPGFAPLHPVLQNYFAEAEMVETLPMRETDLDRPLDVFAANSMALLKSWQEQFVFVDDEVYVEDTAVLQGYDLRTPTIAPGETVQLMTLWQVQNAPEGVRLFTHVLDADGVPIAQADRLDAPSEAWVSGDWLLQLHEFEIPHETAVGEYPLVIGMYTCSNLACTQTQRFPITINGEPQGDTFQLTTVTIE